MKRITRSVADCMSDRKEGSQVRKPNEQVWPRVRSFVYAEILSYRSYRHYLCKTVVNFSLQVLKVYE